jgi:hypothetical protein
MNLKNMHESSVICYALIKANAFLPLNFILDPEYGIRKLQETQEGQEMNKTQHVLMLQW